MNNIYSLLIDVLDEKRVRIVTEDSEYGKLSWGMDGEGHLYCASGSTPEPWDWSPFDDLEEPPGGDAAIKLENDTAELVRAAFSLDIRKP